jgi:CheY-like chemotaxis protein
MNETEKKKILIIEDEKPLSHALELKLSHEGFEVVATNSGAVGLQYLEQSHFDLVLTDLIIPGVDGFKVLETIQEKKMNIPVIVMTNLNQEEDKKRVFTLGACSFFVKSNSPISEIVASVKITCSPANITGVEQVMQPVASVIAEAVVPPVVEMSTATPEVPVSAPVVKQVVPVAVEQVVQPVEQSSVVEPSIQLTTQIITEMNNGTVETPASVPTAS